MSLITCTVALEVGDIGGRDAEAYALAAITEIGERYDVTVLDVTTHPDPSVLYHDDGPSTPNAAVIAAMEADR